ncbi:GntG family PLP-dependent aldolase [Thalassoglobus sp. JC818]|uniref:threonine aldolase family protein n=1 Tax=Thalassoglobus sp. JC818 TaxID=3232136 RepID=UPI003459C43B
MSEQIIELRSDTFTKPTPAMLEAMVSAEVGDDVVGEDPTVNRLEAMVADMCNMPAAVFSCSGTQSNQMAIWAHCERGDEVLIEETGHIANYESGGPSLISGVSLRTVRGNRGLLSVDVLEGRVRRNDDHYAPTRLLCLENSANMGGGTTYPIEEFARVSEWARQQDLKIHLDGARVFNACVARGYQLRDLAEHVDSISICFSKGLGCPMGSILVGDKSTVARARRARKVLGGGLRQAGIVAAAAIYAIENHIDRLKEDHENAQKLAAGLAEIPEISISRDDVETNLVFFHTDPKKISALDLEARLASRGVRLYAVSGPNRLRACTHLGVDVKQIEQAVQAVKSCCVEASLQ